MAHSILYHAIGPDGRNATAKEYSRMLDRGMDIPTLRNIFIKRESPNNESRGRVYNKKTGQPTKCLVSIDYDLYAFKP